jgi:hypothetical protein
MRLRERSRTKSHERTMVRIGAIVRRSATAANSEAMAGGSPKKLAKKLLSHVTQENLKHNFH